MKKTYYQLRPVFFLMLFFQVGFLLFTVYGIYQCFTDISEIKYVIFGILDVLIFTIFTVHYGKGKIEITDNEIIWQKELFVPTHQLNNEPFYHLKYFWFSSDCHTGIIVSEHFWIKSIKKYGLLNDFDESEVRIEEEMPIAFQTNQILVFQLFDNTIHYIRVKAYSKKSIRSILLGICKFTGIKPQVNCIKAFKLMF